MIFQGDMMIRKVQYLPINKPSFQKQRLKMMVKESQIPIEKSYQLVNQGQAALRRQDLIHKLTVRKEKFIKGISH